MAPVRSRRAKTAPHESGMTLVEILVVMAVIAVLFGVGTGVFMGITSVGSREASQQEILNLLRKARSSALGEERSYVVFEDMGKTARGVIQMPVGKWDFEDLEDGSTTGGDRKNGRVHNGILDENGRDGNALALSGGWVDCGNYPDYNATDGLSVELCVKPTAIRNSMTLLQKGRSWRLWLAPGDLGMIVHASIEVGRSGASKSQVHLSGDDVPIPADTWTEISFSYDRSLLSLRVNGTEVARIPEVPEFRDDEDEDEDGGEETPSQRETRPIVRDKLEHLTIGSSDYPIDGLVDTVRVTGVLSGDVVRCPVGVKIECDTDAIHFYNGRLDHQFHAGPVTFLIRWGGRQGRKVTYRIEVGLNGIPISR
jgi:prepilin-type N-terminal cleavage/methylation domain-containing protein